MHIYNIQTNLKIYKTHEKPFPKITTQSRILIITNPPTPPIKSLTAKKIPIITLEIPSKSIQILSSSHDFPTISIKIIYDIKIFG